VAGGKSFDWPRERRQLPASLAAEAAANPGGSVAEIDGSMVSDPDGYVPVEAIVGIFSVGADGRATGDYFRNPGHGPVRDDVTRLEEPDHWLGWLPDAPGRAVSAQLAATLAGQVEGAALEWLKVVDEPAFLTVGVRSPADPGRLIIRRAALALVLAFGVRSPSRGLEILTSVFSWAAVGLDQPGSRRDRTWLDFGMSRERAEELLKVRLYQVGEAG
jgi:hypothetical protein